MIKHVLERGDITMKFLTDYGVISRWAVKHYKIQRADLELLYHLDGLKWFTKKAFTDGHVIYSWDPKRLYRLQNEGFIDKYHKGSKLEGHNKYKLTLRAQMLVKRVYKMLVGLEDVPTGRRNKIMKGETYSDRRLAKGIINKKKTWQ